MMRIVLMAILFTSIVLESTIISFPLTLLALMLVTAFMEEGKTVWAFAVGLILDLFSGRILGSTSLFFLAAMWISYRYRKKIHPMNLYYQLFFLILVSFLYTFLFYKYMDLSELVVIAVFGGVILSILRRFFPEMRGKKGLVVE